MTSFIIISTDKNRRLKYSNDYCKQLHISLFDITVIERDLSAKQVPQSIGIEEIKKIQKKLFLKPVNSQQKAVIIEDAHLLTPEAQNALLKVLEEPPANTLIFLNTENKEMLLPTIHSRCKVIQLEETAKTLTPKETEEISDFLNRLSTISIGERMKIAETKAKDKYTALTWIQNVILLKREQLLKHSDDLDGIITLRQFQNLYTLIKTTNTNARLAIENALLQL